MTVRASRSVTRTQWGGSRRGLGFTCIAPRSRRLSRGGPVAVKCPRPRNPDGRICRPHPAAFVRTSRVSTLRSARPEQRNPVFDASVAIRPEQRSPPMRHCGRSNDRRAVFVSDTEACQFTGRRSDDHRINSKLADIPSESHPRNQQPGVFAAWNLPQSVNH